MRYFIVCAVAALLQGGVILTEHSAGAADLARGKAPDGASVFFVNVQDGDSVGQDVTIKFGVKGIEVKPASEGLVAGSGHHHLLIDTDLPPVNAPIPNDETHKHYGKGQTEDTLHLEPGDHTLQLDFADAAHVQFYPPIVSKRIKIHVNP
jgi:hypothetical protein